MNSDKLLDKVRKEKSKLAKQLHVSESSAIWCGEDKFCVIKPNGHIVRVYAEELQGQLHTYVMLEDVLSEGGLHGIITL